mgnify:CR=1 FL=1
MYRIQPVQIDWKPDKSGPDAVYAQIVRFVCQKVETGEWPVGTRLPSHRELARLFGVNRGTIGKALDMLNSYGLIKGNRGNGTAIASNTWSVLLSPSGRLGQLRVGRLFSRPIRPSCRRLTGWKFFSADGAPRHGRARPAPLSGRHDEGGIVACRVVDRVPGLSGAAGAGAPAQSRVSPSGKNRHHRPAVVYPHHVGSLASPAAHLGQPPRRRLRRVYRAADVFEFPPRLFSRQGCA